MLFPRGSMLSLILWHFSLQHVAMITWSRWRTFKILLSSSWEECPFVEEMEYRTCIDEFFCETLGSERESEIGDVSARKNVVGDSFPA